MNLEGREESCAGAQGKASKAKSRGSWNLSPAAWSLPADFGFSQHMSPWDEKHVLRGSPLYMAPEMVCRRQYDARVDLWSVGVILYGESSVPCPHPVRPALCVLRHALPGHS